MSLPQGKLLLSKAKNSRYVKFFGMHLQTYYAHQIKWSFSLCISLSLSNPNSVESAVVKASKLSSTVAEFCVWLSRLPSHWYQFHICLSLCLTQVLIVLDPQCFCSHYDCVYTYGLHVLQGLCLEVG